MITTHGTWSGQKERTALERWAARRRETVAGHQQELSVGRASTLSLSLSLGQPAELATETQRGPTRPRRFMITGNESDGRGREGATAVAAVVGVVGSLHGWGHFRSVCVISRHRRLCGRQRSGDGRHIPAVGVGRRGR